MFETIRNRVRKNPAYAAKMAKTIENQQALADVLSLNKSPSKWTGNQLKIILKRVKTKADGPMPTLKKELWEMYVRLLPRTNQLIKYEPNTVRNEANEESVSENIPVYQTILGDEQMNR